MQNALGKTFWLMVTVLETVTDSASIMFDFLNYNVLEEGVYRREYAGAAGLKSGKVEFSIALTRDHHRFGIWERATATLTYPGGRWDKFNIEFSPLNDAVASVEKYNHGSGLYE